MRGRKPGQSKITVDDMEMIVRMTEEGKFRSEIAEKIGCSKMTIYLWQKKILG